MPNKAIIIDHNVHDVNSRFNENRLGERARWISSRTSKSAISSEPVPGSSCLPRLVVPAQAREWCGSIVRSTDKWAQSGSWEGTSSWIRVRSPYRSGPLHMHTYAGESCLYPFYKNQCVFCQWIFISSCPVLSGYESAVITRCNHTECIRCNNKVCVLKARFACILIRINQ